MRPSITALYILTSYYIENTGRVYRNHATIIVNNSLAYQGPKLWNTLPLETQDSKEQFAS